MFLNIVFCSRIFYSSQDCGLDSRQDCDLIPRKGWGLDCQSGLRVRFPGRIEGSIKTGFRVPFAERIVRSIPDIFLLFNICHFKAGAWERQPPTMFTCFIKFKRLFLWQIFHQKFLLLVFNQNVLLWTFNKTFISLDKALHLKKFPLRRLFKRGQGGYFVLFSTNVNRPYLMGGFY